MRMRFDDDDEQAFSIRRDQLVEQFATWLAAQQVAGDPSDAELLMDWKFGYGDGALDRWSVADAEEFLLDWCVRKLSAPSTVAAAIPRSVAAFVGFLDATRLLDRGRGPPPRGRGMCAPKRRRVVGGAEGPAEFGVGEGPRRGVGGV